MRFNGFDTRPARRRARELRVMLRTLFAAGVALVAMTGAREAAAALAHSPSIPPAFHGIWQPATRDGRVACADYLKAKPGSNQVVWALVNALMVHPHEVHEVADMGEGNFISVDRLANEAGGVLRVDGRIGLDTSADETSDPTTLRLRRTRNVLELRETFEGRTTRSAYRYCAPLPRD